jgi:prepilin-type N-terminal cleavage/methylation domain-containing protein
MGPARCCPPGFTLVELLAAMALAALLIVGVLSVVRSLGASRRVMAAQADRDGAGGIDVLVDQLRWDLANATQVDFATPNQLQIIGHGGLDPQTKTPTCGPCTLTYAIRQVGIAPHQRPWLVRQQVPPPGSASPAWSELLAGDVLGFGVQPPKEDAAGAAPASAAVAGVPRRLVLDLTLDQGQPAPTVIHRELVIR